MVTGCKLHILIILANHSTRKHDVGLTTGEVRNSSSSEIHWMKTIVKNHGIRYYKDPQKIVFGTNIQSSADYVSSVKWSIKMWIRQNSWQFKKRPTAWIISRMSKSANKQL